MDARPSFIIAMADQPLKGINPKPSYKWERIIEHLINIYPFFVMHSSAFLTRGGTFFPTALQSLQDRRYWEVSLPPA